MPYRTDIPTPSQRFRGETVTKDWVDLEDTIEVDGKKVPYVMYPFPNESDAPVFYSNGKGAAETGWEKSEHDYRDHGGVPITIRFFTDAPLTNVDFVLSDRAGQKRGCRTYLNGDGRVSIDRDWATILAVPEKPLDGLAEYTVQVKCQVGSEHIEKTWSFKTRAK